MIIRIKRRTLEQIIPCVFVLLAIAFVLTGVPFTTNDVIGADNITNKTIIAKVNVSNTDPNITSIRVDDSDTSIPNEIDLTSNDVTTVTCNATVYDYNGFRDITDKNKTNATFYINSVGSSAADDNNSHYTNSSCGSCRQATTAEAHNGDTARTAICDCKFAVQYYANASTSWNCEFTVEDKGGTAISGNEINLSDTDTNSSGITVTELLAIFSPGVLDYGNLSVTQESSEIVHNVTNVGNTPFNLSLRGFGGDDESIGQNVSMICEYGNITFGTQRYSTISGTDYSQMINLTNQTVELTNMPSPEMNLTWPNRIDDSNYGPDRNSTYWKIEVPLGVGGMCNGTIIFGAMDAS